jgi:hypothetical protein
MAWFWYADTMPAVDAKVQALRECLYHNPDSHAAKLGLERLGASVEITRQPWEVEEEYESELELEQEPEPEPKPPVVTETEHAPAIPEPEGPAWPQVRAEKPPVGRRSPTLRVLAYLLGALVGAIVLGFIGLLVTGYSITPLSELPDVFSNADALIGGIGGLVVGAAGGLLIVHAILSRPRSAS